MQQTKIKISVSKKSAIAAGRTSYGDQVVTLSDADVAALTTEEREEILELEPGCKRDGEDGVGLTQTITDNDGLAGVREALQFRRAKRLEEAAKKTREYQEMIAAILAAPDDDLLDNQGTTLAVRPRASGYTTAPWDAPELAARKAALEAKIAAKDLERRTQAERLLAEMRSEKDHYPDVELRECHVGGHLRGYLTKEELDEIDTREETIDAARKATAAAEEEALLQRYRDYALTGAAGEAAKLAAAQGYDVRKAVLDAVEASLPETKRTDYDSPDYEWEERSSPSLAALQLHAQLEAAVVAAKIPEWITIEVSRVQRITEPAPSDDQDEYGEPAKAARHTGVVLTIEAPKAITRYRLYYSE
jgi:hypothetical protein